MTARRCTRRTRCAPATGSATSPPSACSSKRGRATSASSSTGARGSIATPTASSRSGARRRTACGACCTPATRPAAKLGACCGSGRAPSGRVSDDQPRVRHRSRHWEAALCAACTTSIATARGMGSTRAVCSWPRVVPDRTVSRDDQSTGRHRRRRRPRLCRRRAHLADLEFVQFRPTALNRAGAPPFLISRLRGRRRASGQRSRQAFMTRVHADGDLAPRDVGRRAIAGRWTGPAGPVFLTLAHLDPSACARGFRRSPRCAAASASISPAIRFRSARRRTTSWAASTPTSGAGPRCRDSSRRARWPAPASTARIASRATRCSRVVFGARAAIAMQERSQWPR